MIRIDGPIVVLNMTFRAFRWCALVPRRVATDAVDFKVCPGQREIGQVMIKSIRSFPGRVTGKTRVTVV